MLFELSEGFVAERAFVNHERHRAAGAGLGGAAAVADNREQPRPR